ncbi:MAG: hypothetical protein J6I79_03680 [Paludibacteraceae bacterium]|nr:hypothetical protein [Paludibacteraceae bacterium]
MAGKKKKKHKTNKHPKKKRTLIVPHNITMANKEAISPTEVDGQRTIDSSKPVQPEITDTGNTNGNSRSSESNKKESLTKYLWSGVMGALVTLALLVLLAFFIPGFRYSSYYVNEDPSQLSQLLTSNLSERDSVNVAKEIDAETARRKDMIEDLLDQGVIVSSEDFASNLSGYYNALIAVLAAVLVILNLFGFFAWRSNAAEALEQEKRKLSDEIDNIDNRLEKNLDEILRKNQAVREKLESYFQRLIDQDNHLNDDEWDKLRLLLEKYKKKEVLQEIKADEKDNDGSIEEE